MKLGLAVSYVKCLEFPVPAIHRYLNGPGMYCYNQNRHLVINQKAESTDAHCLKVNVNLNLMQNNYLFDITEQYQKSMSQMTLDSLQSQSVNEILESLDHNSVQNTPLPEFSFKGPFGVLNLLPSSISLDDCTGTDSASTVTENLREATDTSYSARDDVALENNETTHSLSVQWNDSPTINTSPLSFPQLNSHPITETAKYLLRYFESDVVSFSLSLKDSELCPWKNIHVPSAKRCFAELLLHQTANSLDLALFYSLLAASCFHLSQRTEESRDWDTFGKDYKQTAMYHLNLSIQKETATDGQMPYKELLTALLSMAMLNVCEMGTLIFRRPLWLTFSQITCGDYHGAQNFLIESECLIRKRGLSKQLKSLKVRSLHHTYTYLRIMAETTCGCALVQICPTRPNPGLVSDKSTLQSLRSFRLPDSSTEYDLDCDAEKSDDAGYDDIHLELLGSWKGSLFQEMYGVPESLMGLLSQTVRLANEQELLHRDSEPDPDIIITLNKRTRILEQSILSWNPSSDDTSPDTASEYSAMKTRNAEVTYCKVMAFSRALILFYYRRIHNINALILQDTVRKVIDSIQQAEVAAPSNENYTASLLWPAFIASCEAVDADLQERLREWLISTGNHTRIPSFDTASQVAQRVWDLRQQRKDYTLSWFNAVSEDRCPILVI